MLLRFGVSNHRSIRSYQEVQFTASRRFRGFEEALADLEVVDAKVLPVLAIYGPNASGKSNFLDAIDDMRLAILNSYTRNEVGGAIPRAPFLLDSDCIDTPTRFDCTFAMPANPKYWEHANGQGSIFEYGFTFDSRRIVDEWLWLTLRGKRASTRLIFERETSVDGDVVVKFGPSLKGENRAIQNLTRPNSLFLSAAAQGNHKQLISIYEYFRDHWETVLDGGPMDEVSLARALTDYPHQQELEQILRQADLGISGVNVAEADIDESQQAMAEEMAALMAKYSRNRQPDAEFDRQQFRDFIKTLKRVSFSHTGVDGSARAFRIQNESQGTRTLASLLVPALRALHRGGLLVIDELNTSMHTRLTRAFVSLFMRRRSNPLGAQLVFSTHDVALLNSELLRTDQIWLADKSEEGETDLSPLSDFSVRSRDNIEIAYRLGRFGGVPASDEFDVTIDLGTAGSDNDYP